MYKTTRDIYVAYVKAIFSYVWYTMKHRAKLFNNESDILPSEKISLSFLSRSFELRVVFISYESFFENTIKYTFTHMLWNRMRGKVVESND